MKTAVSWYWVTANSSRILIIIKNEGEKSVGLSQRWKSFRKEKIKVPICHVLLSARVFMIIWGEVKRAFRCCCRLRMSQGCNSCDFFTNKKKYIYLYFSFSIETFVWNKSSSRVTHWVRELFLVFFFGNDLTGVDKKDFGSDMIINTCFVESLPICRELKWCHVQCHRGELRSGISEMPPDTNQSLATSWIQFEIQQPPK